MSMVRSALKLRQLEYFLAVARTLHFSNAASELFVSQPTLSHQIAELESQVGTPLFNRNGKAVALTEAGKAFRPYAMRAIAELNAGCAALEELTGLKRGQLRIGVSQSFVRKLLPPILGEFVRDYPGIELTVAESTAAEIEEGLAASLLDVGIAFAPAVREETELEPILEERLMLVMRPAHPLARLNPIPMKRLDGQPIAMLGKSYSTRGMIESFLKTAGAAPNLVCETNSIAIMLGVVGNSDVVAIVPEGAVSANADLAICALSDPAPVRVSALLWSRHNFRSHAANAFAGLVRQRFAQFLPLMSPPPGRNRAPSRKPARAKSARRP